MPAKLSPLSTFLGFELASDQIRAVVVDEELTILGHETVEFDSELAEFGTRLGVHNAPGDTYTAPVDMWIKSLDLLLDKLHLRFDLSKVKSIGGCAQHALIYFKNPSLIQQHLLTHPNPNKTQPLHAFLLSANLLSSAQSSVVQDASPLLYAQALETALGGPEAMASRTGQSSHVSLPAVQLLKFRETQPDAWASTKRIMWTSNFLAALFLGSTEKASVGLPEIMASGMWNVKSGVWDEGVVEMVAQTTAGNNGAQFMGGGANRLKEMLGPVEMYGGKSLGSIAPYFVEKYGFDKDAFVVPFTSDHLSSYVSICPNEKDSVLSFGPHDVLMTPAPSGSPYLPSSLYTLLPHPAQDPSEPKKYIAMLSTRNADAPRALVRDMYTKSWSAFDRLVSVIAPGGSIGLDNKLFSFWILQSENAPFQHVKGVYRFETGVVTNEFRDLRANPRCLLESQLLSFRVRFARMMASPLFSSSASADGLAKKVNSKPISLLATRLGTRFDPYDASNLPHRLIAIGSVAHFPSVVSLVGDVFNASIFVPSSSTSGASSKPEQSPGGITSPPLGGGSHSPSRISAALGGAYIARWAWRRSIRPDDKYDSFDSEVKDLLKKKWHYSAMHRSNSTNTVLSQSNAVGGASNVVSPPGSGAGGSMLVTPVVNVIGSSMPIKRSGLASAAYPLVEDDEEDEEMNLHNQQQQMLQQHLRGKGLQQPHPLVGLGIGAVPDILNGGPSPSSLVFGRARTPTTSSTNSSNALTALSIGTSNMALGTNPNGTTPAVSPAASNFHTSSSPASAVAPLTVIPLPTDDKDAQAGLVKVSDADHDAFMTYAAIVPEYCRLEGMLIKNLV